ncbi:MAG: hypothetical protein PHQ59_04020 [Candidatus Daviesbacteria bacterium]|nr:hypothetical protein [Candidatus Daviesbacteria bacterium]
MSERDTYTTDLEMLKAEAEKSLTELREQITYFAKFHWDSLVKLGIVTLVTRREELSNPDMDCGDYIFGEGKEEIIKEITRTEAMTLAPQPGDYAVYLSDDFKFQLHYGRVTEDGKVISKWGPDGDVYKSEPLKVPLCYGKNLFYFKQPETT